MRKAIALIAAGLTLAACSTGTPSTTPTSTSASTTNSAPVSTPTTSTSTEASSSPTGAATSAAPTATDSSRTQSALAAIKTAETSASGKAIELDWSSNRWEVTVVAGKKTQELDVSANGQKVVRRHTEVTDPEDYKRLQSVKHSMADAIQTATAQTPGDLAEADLESRRSKVVWELSIEKTGAGFANVYVDAVSGKITR